MDTDADLPDISQQQPVMSFRDTSKEMDDELQSIKTELINVHERLKLMLKALSTKGDERTRLIEELKNTEFLFNNENADPSNSVRATTQTVISSNLDVHNDSACETNDQEEMEVNTEEQVDQSVQEQVDEEANTEDDSVAHNLFSLLQQAPPDSPIASNANQNTAPIEDQNASMPQLNSAGFEDNAPIEDQCSTMPQLSSAGFEEIMKEVLQPSPMMPETSNNSQNEKRKKEKQKRQRNGTLPSGDLVDSLLNLASHANDSTVVGEVEMIRPKPEQLENEEPVMDVAAEIKLHQTFT
ncbi:hypothetical protein M3Y97_00690000 [Aphelenchoides bicaudatus]|nr:hypothetical protein M3Y97_00690000 [Aphelenchoides bicaudatus]